ncbi:hypothetical protein DFH08DRAFT_1000310 [Mycena albidolilacea]|uniref:FAD-binding PCMH-type domain-containing protein n=1 Tax=Mycena albidolilacea TaxID=1033008 RepID=A0AAD7ERI5_9AGAR|nr:hypothetical protein DFH08DRAFT_1000310 [Mycena albidolilacea]
MSVEGVDTTVSAQYTLLPADQQQHSPVSAEEKNKKYEEMILSRWPYILIGVGLIIGLIVWRCCCRITDHESEMLSDARGTPVVAIVWQVRERDVIEQALQGVHIDFGLCQAKAQWQDTIGCMVTNTRPSRRKCVTFPMLDKWRLGLNAAGLNLTKLDHVRTSVVPKASRLKHWAHPLWLLGMLLCMSLFSLSSTDTPILKLTHMSRYASDQHRSLCEIKLQHNGDHGAAAKNLTNEVVPAGISQNTAQENTTVIQAAQPANTSILMWDSECAPKDFLPGTALEIEREPMWFLYSRCTMYKPILDAAKTFVGEYTRKLTSSDHVVPINLEAANLDHGDCCSNPGNPGKCLLVQFPWFSLQPYKVGTELIFLPILTKQVLSPLKFGSASRQWLHPTTLSELLAIKAQYLDAKLVGGSAEIQIEVKSKPQHIPSQSSSRTLRNCTVCSHRLPRTILKSPASDSLTSPIEAVWTQLQYFAGLQIRNVTSVGGNITTASPISDLNPVWAASNVIGNGSRKTPVRASFG